MLINGDYSTMKTKNNDKDLVMVLTLRNVAVTILLFSLVIVGMILWTQDVGMLDNTIKLRASCEYIEKLIYDPIKLHVGMDTQELRELYRDKGCTK